MLGLARKAPGQSRPAVGTMVLRATDFAGSPARSGCGSLGKGPAPHNREQKPKKRIPTASQQRFRSTNPGQNRWICRLLDLNPDAITPSTAFTLIAGVGRLPDESKWECFFLQIPVQMHKVPVFS